MQGVYDINFEQCICFYIYIYIYLRSILRIPVANEGL